MASIYDFSRQIKEYCKAKNYTQALEYFKVNKVNFDKQLIASNQYLIGDILSCLRHTNHFDAGFQFLHNYEIKIDEHTPEVILNAYAWLLYDILKTENSTESIDEPEEFTFDIEEDTVESNNSEEKTDLYQKIEVVIQLLQVFESSFSKNVMEFLFKSVLKVEKKKPRPAWNFIIEFCDRIDPEKLSTECRTIQVKRKGQFKDMIMASSKEEWYAHLSKALFQTQQFERCYDVSKKALEIFTEFHYGYDIWFARRIALCKKAMGNIDEAIIELETILRKKKEWFILKELAEIYQEKGNNDKAFTLAKKGMLAYGDLEYKVELLEFLGNILKQKSEVLLSYQHFTLVALIREENQWKISNSLIQVLNTFKNMPEYKLNDKPNLIKELTLYWNKDIQYSKREPNQTMTETGLQFTGVVKKLLNPTDKGKQGFISKDTGGDVFFFLNKEHKLYNEITVGMKVSFQLEPDKNGKGDRAKLIKKNR
jgi:tetratricopeptide (TPR) repeat protein